MDNGSLKTIAAQLAVLPDNEDRQVRRRAVNFAASLAGAGARTESVSVLDLSSRGFRIRREDACENGSILLIKLPGIEAVRARVVWCRNGELGCAFEEELDQTALEVLLPRPKRTQPTSVFGRRCA